MTQWRLCRPRRQYRPAQRMLGGHLGSTLSLTSAGRGSGECRVPAVAMGRAAVVRAASAAARRIDEFLTNHTGVDY